MSFSKPTSIPSRRHTVSAETIHQQTELLNTEQPTRKKSRSLNSIDIYNNFIQQYNQECNKVNLMTLQELPWINLGSPGSQIDVFDLALARRIFQENHQKVQYNRCYERMSPTSSSSAQISSWNYKYVMKCCPFDKTQQRLVMEYTRAWAEENNRAFQEITSFFLQEQISI